MWCPNQECPDAQETGSPAELRDDLAACPFCGAALSAAMPEWANPQEEPPLVPVLTIAQGSWLPQIKEILDSAGIPYMVSDEGAQQPTRWEKAAPGLSSRMPVVMVEESDAERATALLADLKDSLPVEEDAAAAVPPSESPSHCNACGKELESSEGDEPLTYCYHCGASLAAT